MQRQASATNPSQAMARETGSNVSRKPKRGFLQSSTYGFPVMAGLVPAIHVLNPLRRKDVDGRNKCGHDDGGCQAGLDPAILIRKSAAPHTIEITGTSPVMTSRALPPHTLPNVMAGLVPAIHVLDPPRRKDVDTRDKRGHDGGAVCATVYH